MRAVAVSDLSQVGDARRVCVDAALAVGFDATASGRVAIVATELASNLLRHGGGGEILVDPWDAAAGAGIDLLALDRGPGMTDALACLRDGYSTAGSAGTGLGAVRRQSRYFAVYAPAGGGTAVLAGLPAHAAAASSAAASSASPAWGAICVPQRGETACGDAWAAAAENGVQVFLLADGLGHGPDAARAAAEAVRLFRQAPFRPPAAILEAIHQGLRSTRGAAVAIARLEPRAGRAVFVGIGNISGALVSGTEIRRMVSHTGIAGHQVRRIQEFTYPCPPGCVLVMHSDGLASGWTMPRRDGGEALALTSLPPRLAAGVLYRDHARGRDDCCVLVARATP